MRHLRLRGAAAAVVLGGCVLLPSAPAFAAVGACEEITQPDEPTDPVTSVGRPVDTLGIAQLQADIRALGVEPGHGVGVAVVDSGIKTEKHPVGATDDRVGLPKSIDKTTITDPAYAVYDTPKYFHGTAAAGLVAGAPLAGKPGEPDRPVGVAPGASLVDVHFYEPDGSTDAHDKKLATLSTSTLVHALRSVVPKIERDGIRVVLVPLAVKGDDDLARVVSTLTQRGVVVVAPSGDRPSDGEGPTVLATPQSREDAADAIYPAGYAVDDPLVVAVGSTVEDAAGTPSTDPLSAVLASSAIDVVAPSAGGVSYGLNGQSCTLPDVRTAWSASTVAGVIAALMSARPHDTSQQVVSRLEATATGSAGAPGLPGDRFTGHGVIQPLEALHRPLVFDDRGFVVASSLPADDVAPAVLPTTPPDVLASTKSHALWWGLAGGGALVVAMTLRPVLARRRRPT